ncbi:MAG TPA: MarR family transcriptional regulator [Thermoanaerobaculia bacterium]|nr:MarR family transcriptional regulator [Thermoanaerobaculia bacterium]
MTNPSRIAREIKQTRPFASRAQETVVALLRTADMARRVVTAIVEPHDLTTQQYNVLRILRGAGEAGLPTLEIAERMIDQTPGITRLIDRLETKQLVRRERCLTDRRQVFCRITKNGLKLLASLDEPLRQSEEQVLASLTRSELTQLIHLLDKTRDGIAAALQAQRPDHS